LLLNTIFACSLFMSAANAESAEVVNTLLNLGEYEAALGEVEKVLADKPGNERVKLQKGFILIKLRKLDEAEAFYNSLVKEQPANPEPMNNLGVIYQLKREYKRAIEQLNATIAKFPEFGRAYENLGDTYIQMASDSYAAGRERVDNDPMLISKADLGLRFYGLARANQENAVKRYQEAGDGGGSAADDDNASDNPRLAGTEQEVADFLRSWVVAWSGQDLDSYFGHYGEDFAPSGGLNAWQDRKRRVINAAKFINIRVESIEVLNQEPDQLTIRFNQNYESNTYQSESLKTLVLKLYGNEWKIIDED